MHAFYNPRITNLFSSVFGLGLISFFNFLVFKNNLSFLYNIVLFKIKLK